jgi:hypothetical protein
MFGQCGVMHQVNPQFRPDGGKKLRDGFGTQAIALLFHQTDRFYRKKKAILLILYCAGGHPPRTSRFLLIFNLFSTYKRLSPCLEILD